MYVQYFTACCRGRQCHIFNLQRKLHLFCSKLISRTRVQLRRIIHERIGPFIVAIWNTVPSMLEKRDVLCIPPMNPMDTHPVCTENQTPMPNGSDSPRTDPSCFASFPNNGSSVSITSGVEAMQPLSRLIILVTDHGQDIDVISERFGTYLTRYSRSGRSGRSGRSRTEHQIAIVALKAADTIPITDGKGSTFPPPFLYLSIALSLSPSLVRNCLWHSRTYESNAPI
ncbi:hypothetical protein F4809DRAFT_199427 [Biscogniauxia mediterranea]|nr:hypothetical protein F4809DRAFT_199427 [Biscogniauxia mediterranea]